MSAFPPPGENTLRDQRDALLVELSKLEAIIAIARTWVDGIEQVRIQLPPEEDAAYDAGNLPVAVQLLTGLLAETSTTATSGLNVRIRNTIGLK